MKKEKEQLMLRDDYRKIKSMTREQMTNFLYNFATDSVHGSMEVDIEAMKKEIGQIKGIGPVKLEEIMAIIEKYFVITKSEK